MLNALQCVLNEGERRLACFLTGASRLYDRMIRYVSERVGFQRGHGTKGFRYKPDVSVRFLPEIA